MLGGQHSPSNAVSCFNKKYMKIIEKYQLQGADIDRIVEMAWEDRTPFDAITLQFGLSEKEIIELATRARDGNVAL